MALRRCSECPNSLAGKPVQTKTCSNKCRCARSRRMRRNRRHEEEIAALPTGAQEIASIVQNETYDQIKRVIQNQLEPVVREALTEDVLRAVQQMLGLTSRAVELLQEDLESDDSTVRQRAYTLITKYTIGHPALLKAQDTDGSKQLVVNFNLPRPEEDGEPDPELVDGTSDELRVCDICDTEKPAAEFVAGSSRCAACMAKKKAEILEQFAN